FDRASLEVVFPAANGARDVRLDDALVEVWRLARARAHQHVDAREHRLREAHGEFRRRPVQVLLQDLLDAHAHIGVVVLAWQEDEAGIEAAINIAANEDARLAAVAEAQDAHRSLEEQLLVDLEELVTRIVLQHREQVLERVAVLAEARALHHAIDLALQ